MDLASSLQATLLLDGTRVKSRDQAVEAMLAQLAVGGVIPSDLVGTLRDSIARRDELGPTGIGQGVAIPHAWHRGLDQMAVALAVSRDGLDYPSLDRQLIHIVLLVLTPPKAEYEPAKREIFDLWLPRLRQPAFRASLMLAATADELQHAIRAPDQTHS